MVFTPNLALQPDEPIELPCGQCVGCRLERSRQWAMRCIHEAQTHEENCFITLTFNEEELFKRERPLSIDVREFQKFMKRLRKKYPNKNIRYMHAGEYGDKSGRPHYHAILFGIDFNDKKLYTIRNSHRLYTSQTLDTVWGFGFTSIGDVTFESAAYVARYCMKKITGDVALSKYQVFDEDTGEILYDRDPEYATMSKNPAVGKAWFEQFKGDVYPKDYVTINGRKMKPPKYYDKMLEKSDPFMFDEIKEERIIKGKEMEDQTRERLDTQEEVKKHRIKQLKREL